MLLALFLALLLVAAVFSFGVAAYAFRYRETPGARPFVLLLVGNGLYALVYFCELLAPTLPEKIIWDNLLFTISDITTIGYLIFALVYTRRTEYIRRLAPVFWALILINAVMVWSDSLHHLVRSSSVLLVQGDLIVLSYDYGPWFGFWLIYIYLISLSAVGLLIVTFIQTPRFYRLQVGAVVVAMLAPFIAGWFSISGLVPLPGLAQLDINPIGYALVIPVWAWAIFHQRFLDLIPVARDHLIDVMPDGVLVVDMQQRIVDSNAGARVLLHSRKTSPIGMCVADVMPSLATALATVPAQVIINTESSANANDIQDVAEWLEVSSIPLSDRRKRQLGWLIVLSDRTEQWRMEQALREQNTYLEQEISDRQRAEEAYLNLVDYSLQGLAIFQDERFVFANAAMTDMLGYTVEELLALEPGMVWQLIHPDDRALVAHYTQTRNAGLPAPTRYEVRLLHKAGAVRWAEVFVAPITFLGRSAYQIAYIDITERKQAEEALRKLQQAIEQSPSSIMITDRDAHIEYVNPRFTSLTGYTLDEVRGTTPRMLKTAHTATTVYQDLWATILAGNEWRGEFCNRTKTGDIYWEWASIAPIVDAAGQITHFVAVKEDITERKRTQAQLQQQQQALAMFRERERLARELHDTVGQVLGYVQAQLHVLRDLLHRGELTEADLILERLTTVAHETHGDMRAFIVGVQTGDTLKQGFVPSVERYLERYEQIYGIQTTLTVAPNLVDHPFAPVVEAHLVRIIQEALSNTRKHAEASQIDVTFEQYADQMRLVIADNGRGFDPSALPADTAQGFGLQSMQERVREIEGIFRIETPSGGGTHVIVHVPLQNLDAPRIKGLRVLLVDDQQLFLEGIQNMLTSRGIPVVGTARNGQEALEQARCLRPDVILMDVDMPVCDGLEATRRIKAELPDIQIVMLTVSADDDTLFEAIKGGAVGYLLKNLDVRDFFALLAGLERGEVVLAPEMAQKLVREFARPYQPATAAPTETKASAATEPTAPRTHAPDAVTQLTEREFEVLGLVAQGHTYRAVGERMGYSERTIKTVMSSILKKLHLKNRAAAVAYARKLGLASEGSDQD